MSAKQRIVVELDSVEDQEFYNLVEKKGYEALRHFFEDIGFKVACITSTIIPSATREAKTG